MVPMKLFVDIQQFDFVLNISYKQISLNQIVTKTHLNTISIAFFCFKVSIESEIKACNMSSNTKKRDPYSKMIRICHKFIGI